MTGQACGRVSRLLALTCLLLQFLACGKNEPRSNETESLEAQRQVPGDVFIVTRSGENVKLGLVLVSAYPESVILRHLEKKKEAEATLGAQIHPEIERAKQRLDAAETEHRTAVRAWDALPWPKNNEDTEGFEARERAQKRIRRAEGEATAARNALYAAQGQYAALGSIPFRFEGLPVAQWSAKTDADGRFLLAVPDGITLVLVATSRRELLGSTEEYYWMIRLPQGSPQSRIFLSNDNVAGIGSMESLL